MPNIVEQIQFNKLTQEEMLLCLDRLTRFKIPVQKYYRVFSDILTHFLIKPKLNLKTIEKMDISELVGYVELVWNESAKTLIKDELQPVYLSSLVFDFEDNYFCLDEDEKIYLNSKLDIAPILACVKDFEGLPFNLKSVFYRFKENISDYTELIKFREKNKLKFPLASLVLCEGLTEEILLPEFSRIGGFDFFEKGIYIKSAGGKNQVARLYYELKDVLKLPIFIILDKDASSIAESLREVLKEKDTIYVLKSGEFEDVLPNKIIKKAINKAFKNEFQITVDDIPNRERRAQSLDELMKQHCVTFKKADFAKMVKSVLDEKMTLSGEILEIIEFLKSAV